MDRPTTPPDLHAYLSQRSQVESELSRLFSRNASLLIFDIGSCEGEDSVRYARQFPNARVVAFEPLPANQSLIRANFTRHGLKNCELVPLALSDRAGTANFHVSSGRPQTEFAGRDWNYGNKSSSLLAPASDRPMYGWIEFHETIPVRTETLDAFCRTRGIDRIDFIHMDVQGAEALVLAGATAMLPHVTAWWLEVSDKKLYAGQVLRPEIEELMRRQGFTLVFEERREIEGDQFYVKTRRVRTISYLALHRARSLYRRVRSLGRRLRRVIAAEDPPCP